MGTPSDKHVHGEEVLYLPIAQFFNRRIVCGAFDAAVPAVVVVAAVAVVFAVLLVVFLLVGDQVVEGEAIVAGDEIYALLGLAFSCP